MNTTALSATPHFLATMRAERVRLAQWAFATAVRLSDQNRPLALKLCIECMLAARALMLLLGARRQAAPARRQAVHTPRRASRTVPVSASAVAPLIQTRRITPLRRVRRHSLAGHGPASVQQIRRFLCMVGLDG